MCVCNLYESRILLGQWTIVASAAPAACVDPTLSTASPPNGTRLIITSGRSMIVVIVVGMYNVGVGGNGVMIGGRVQRCCWWRWGWGCSTVVGSVPIFIGHTVPHSEGSNQLELVREEGVVHSAIT